MKKIGNLALLFSCVLASLISFDQAGWNITMGHIPWEAWILLPYSICWLLSYRLYRSSNPKYGIFAMLFSMLVFLFSVFIYGGLYVGKVRSTQALVFLFVPLYLVIATIIVLGTANFLLIYKNRVNHVAA